MSQESYALEATTRNLIGRKVRRLRKEGLAPAVLYGHRVEPTNLQLDVREFETVYRRAGQTALVDLQIGAGAPVKVFVQEVQRHPISQALQHVDFHAVNLRQEITAEVPVVLIGEAPAVHNNEGVLLRGLETVTVHALPADLPQHLEVSLESLQAVDDAVHVSDLHGSGNFQITTDSSEMLVKITAPQLEPEIEEAAEVEEAEGAAAESEDETAAAEATE